MENNMIDVLNLDFSSLETMKNEKIIELIPLAQAGDEKVKDELVQGNLKFVLSVVKKFDAKEANINDLFQVGCIGLLKAIDDYDVNYGIRFTTYALPKIIGEIRIFLRKNRHIPLEEKLARLNERERDVIHKRYYEAKTQNEIAKEMGISQAQVSKIEKEALKIIFDDNDN